MIICTYEEINDIVTNNNNNNKMMMMMTKII